MFPISEEEKDLKIWCTKYLGFLFARPNSSRRRELIKRFGGSPATEVSSPSPQLNDSSLQPTSGEHSSNSPNSASVVLSSKRKKTVVSVVVNAAVTFFFCPALYLLSLVFMDGLWTRKK